MSNDFDARIKVGADTRDAEAGIDRVNSKVASMGDSASKAGAKAGTAFDGMVKSSEGAAAKMDQSTRSAARSMERYVAELQAGSKNTAAYHENMAKQRGADMAALGPYLQQMRLAEKQAEESMKTMGMSAKATAAALRGVPAQFTDIFVSLQGGQAPLTVLLQQGGQLKDMFGGVGNAAKAMGGYVLGLISPLSVAGAALVALGAAYYVGAKEQEAYVKAIVMTGNASGMTTSQLQLLAAELEVVVGSQGRAAAALAEFTRANVKGSDSLKDFAQAAIDWEKATGVAVEDTAKAFGKLQEDPLKAAMELHKGMNFLTVATYEQIRALQEQGDAQGAAKVAMNAYKDALNSGSSQIKDNLGYLEKAWSKLGGTASKVWDIMLGAGRAATVADKMGGLREDIAAMEKQLADGKGFGNTAGGAATGRGRASLTQQDIQLLQDRIALRKQELSTLEKTTQAEKESAELKAKEGEKVKAREEWNERGLKYLTDAKKLERALQEERERGAKAGIEEKEIEKRLAAITEEHNKKGASAAKAYNKELTDQQKLIGELSGLSSTFYKDWESLNKQYAQGRISLEALEKAQAKLLAKQPFSIALVKEEAEATNARVKAYEDDLKTQDALLKKRQESATKAEEAVQKALEEEEAYGLAASAGITLAEAVAQIAVARAEDAYQQARNRGTDAETLLALYREVEARKKLVEVMGQKGVREANKKAADEATKTWDKVSDSVGQMMADAIVMDGASALQALERAATAIVLRPAVQVASENLMGALGLGTKDSAAGKSTAASMIQNGHSIYGALTGSLTYGLGSAIAGMGATLGSAAATSFGAGMAASGFTAGAFGAGASMVGAGAASTGLGMMAGAALPWVAGGLAVINLLGGIGKQVTPHAGAASEYQVGNLIGGNAQTAQNLVNAGDSYLEQMQKPMDSLVLTIGSSLDALAKNFGKTSGYSVGAGFTSDNNDKSAGFFHLITPDGQTLDKWTISRKDQHYKDRGGMYDSDSAKGFDEYLKDVAFASLSGVADIVPAWAADMAKATKDSLADASGADSITAFQNLVTQIAVIEGAFTSLGQVMPMFVGITDDMKSSFLELFGTIDNLTAATSSFYGLLYSEQERMTTAGNQINDTLKELNIFSERGGIDVFNGEAAKAQLKLAVEELMAAGNAELAGKLMLMTQSFVSVADYAAKAAQEAAKAAQDAYNNARDTAFANLESAVDRERSYWDDIASAAQTAVSSLSSTLNLLTSNARDLYGTVDTTQQMLAAQGMVYIEDALAGVRGGASASSYSGLQDAITAARGGVSGGRYASQFDKDRDALVLAGQLSQLGDLTGNQLSVEERSLKAAQTQIELLDQTLDYWRELIDGNKAGNLSVVEAISLLAQAMGVTAGGPGGLLGGGGGASFGGGSGAAGSVGSVDPESFKYIRDTWLYDNHYARRGTDDAALDPLADLMRSFSGSKDSFAMLSAARDAGYRLTDVQAASTAVDGVWRASTYEQWLQEAQRVGIPAFDVGTNLVPHDMLAVVHKNEAIVPAAFNPWAGGSGMGLSTARLESLVERLIDENRHLSDRLLAIERNTQGLPQMADQFDTVASSGRVRVGS